MAPKVTLLKGICFGEILSGMLSKFTLFVTRCEHKQSGLWYILLEKNKGHNKIHECDMDLNGSGIQTHNQQILAC